MKIVTLKNDLLLLVCDVISGSHENNSSMSGVKNGVPIMTLQEMEVEKASARLLLLYYLLMALADIPE